MKLQPDTWDIAAATARLGEVIDPALADGPQVITRHGRAVAVIVSAAEWQHMTTWQGNLAEFFAASPLRQSGIMRDRSGNGPRQLDP